MNWRNTTLAIFLGCSAATGLADTSTSTWGAATHFGFAIVDRSTTGFEEAQGSLMFFDAYRRWDAISVGLRTVTQGGQGDGQEYYRFGTGPVVKWSSKAWTLHGSVGAFNETAMAGGDETYRSRGQTFLIGWQRSREIVKNAVFSWGGFVTGHQGNLTAAAGQQSPGNHNRGLSHGVEISIHMGL